MGNQRIKFRIFNGARQKHGLAATDSTTSYRDWIDYSIEAVALGYYSSFTTSITLPGSAHAGAHLLRDQYSPLEAVLERASIFRKVFQKMGADSSERQIASAATTMDMWRQSLGRAAGRHGSRGETSPGHPAIVHQDGTGDPDIDAELGRNLHDVIATRDDLR